MTHLKITFVIFFCFSTTIVYPQWAEAGFWKDVGRSLKDFGKGVADIVEASAKLSGVNVAAKLIKGDSPEKVIKEAWEDTKDLARATSRNPSSVTSVSGVVRQKHAEAIREVYGDDIGDVFVLSANTQRFLEHLPSSALESLIVTLEKQDLRYIAAARPAIFLAAALRQAQEYFEGRAQPLPEKVKTGLSLHFDPHDLVQARYVVSDDPTTLNGIINWLQVSVFGSEGSNHAVVAGNIIVFAEAPSDDNLGFWAHEVLHTIQFRRLGIDLFAHEYVLDHRAIEREAELKEGEVTANPI